jgi:hypothetical protein
VSLFDQIGPYFGIESVVRQRYPISPINYNVDVDALHMLISRAQEDGLLNVVVSDSIEEGVAVLQYAYIIVFFFRVTWKVLEI